ncbi:hypothetical protein JTE90_004343 [Oedothorax gibbosus]|uniref:Small-subunit processome Utp12 domain-containing protein n=1 Tax=Oedothorax gibbosus TaxID=931172 RepID=A0AAV6VLP0_9ARAC|nr:hypothetical protein JTE90_004343 [Oedothorax gibbosus]
MTTKQYLRFTPGDVFGVIGSSTAQIIPLKSNQSAVKDALYAVPACENVYVWNLRTKEKALILQGGKSTVTCLVADSNHRNLAAGYADGSIQIFDLRTGNSVVSFIGHKTAVSCLTYEEGGSTLASGGKDSEIVIWSATDEAGLYRLKGHKGPISKCLFFKPKNTLISSSKDTYIKFWDLDTQHCFYSLVGCRYEILDIAIIKETKLITGLNNQKLRVWDIIFDADDVSSSSSAKKLKTDILDGQTYDGESDKETEDNNTKVVELGELPNLENKTSSIIVDPTERLMGIHGSTKSINLFKILTPVEITKKLRKRRTKEAKRKKDDDEEESSETVPSIVDEFRALQPIQLKGKVDSFSLSVDENDVAKITVLLKNNNILQYHVDLKIKNFELEMLRNITLPGHRSFVRTLSCSSDGLSILSACDESVKIWKSFNEVQKCSTTLDCDLALCSLFVIGDKHCIIGTKKGELNIFDVEARELVNSIDSHDGAVRCMCLSPGQSGITSGGSDKEVKFWDFELLTEDTCSDKKKGLSLLLKRKLEMPEEILCLKYSPDNRKIAIALLDTTVQVLFADSLKLAFSLYGHALPVTCLDICHDSTLIITGSNDRTIRIWSMEFGSCNRRIKIKNEKGLPDDKGITCLQFLPKTHLFFTGGKDHVVRQWDADSFQKITTLKGHQNEITAMSVSPDGLAVITASKDRSIRTWEKTTEPLVLEEEQEIEAEEREKEIEDLPDIPGESNKEVALPGMKTTETIKTVDQLIEAMQFYASEVSKMEEYKLECKAAKKELPPPPVHPLLMAYKTSDPLVYIRKCMLKIRPSELEGALLHLPFHYVLEFLKIIAEFVEKGWETEFCEKCTTFLVRIHFGEISTTRSFLPVIEKLKAKLFAQMYHVRDMVGFAKVVSSLQQKAIDAREEVSMFAGILEGIKKKKKKAKRKLERPVVAFS